MAQIKLALLLAPAFVLGSSWGLPAARADDSNSADGPNAAADVGAASGNGFGVGVGISISTTDAAGNTKTVGTASTSAGSTAQSIGNASATGVGQGLATATPNATTPGAATSISAGAGLSVTYTGPDGIGLATGAGFGLNASSAVDTTGAGSTNTTSTSAATGTGNVTAGPPTGDADGDGSSSGTADTPAGGTAEATSSSTNTSTADATAAGTGTALISFVDDPSAPVGDVLAALTQGAGTAADGAHAALFSQTAAGSATANLTLGAGGTLSTTGNDAYGLLAATVSGGTGTGNFLFSGPNSGISTTGTNSLGAFVLFGGAGNADVNFTLGGTGSNITTTGADSTGAYLAATSSGTNTVNLDLSGSGANISTQGLESYGAFLLGMGTGGAVDLTMSGTNSAISTVGDQSVGAYLYTQGTLANLALSGGGSSISTQGADSFGAFVANAGLADGAVTLGLGGSGATITTAGDSAVGLFGYSSGNNATIAFDASGANSGVTTGGDDAHAVFLTGLGAVASTIDLNLSGAGASLNTTGANAIGAVVSASGAGASTANIALSGTGAGITTVGNNAFGVALLGQGGTSATVGLDLGGENSTITTGGDGAVGAFVTASSSGASTAKVTLSGKNARISTGGVNAFGIYVGGSGTSTNLEVNFSGEGANVATTGAGASGVIFGGDGGSLFLSGYGSKIWTGGAAAQGVVFDGDNGLVDLGPGTMIKTDGPGSVAVLFQPGTTGQTVRNAGTIWSMQSLGISGGNGTDALINSGRIVGGGGTAFNLMGGADSVTLQAGSRIVGRMDLGTGANSVRLETGRDAAWLWSFDGTLPNADITVTGGSPSVILRPGLGGSTVTVATVDTTGFASAGSGLADLLSSLGSVVDSRLIDLTQAIVPPLAFASYANVSNIETRAAGELAALESGGGYGGPGTWAKAFVSQRIQQDNRPTLGSSTTLAGFALGVDISPQADRQFGVFGGISTSRLDVDRSIQDIDSLAGFLGAYGRLEFADKFVDLIGSTGFIDYESDRLVVNNLAPGGLETASADYNGWYISPELVIGQNTTLASGTVMTPKARVRYSALWIDGYRETGSSANLTVKDRKVQTLEGRLELAFSKVETNQDGNQVRTNWYVGALERSRLGDETVEATLLGQNLPFTVPGDDNVYGGYVGAGLNFWTSDNTNLFASAEFEVVSDKSVSGMFEMGARVTF